MNEDVSVLEKMDIRYGAADNLTAMRRSQMISRVLLQFWVAYYYIHSSRPRYWGNYWEINDTVGVPEGAD